MIALYFHLFSYYYIVSCRENDNSNGTRQRKQLLDNQSEGNDYANKEQGLQTVQTVFRASELLTARYEKQLDYTRPTAVQDNVVTHWRSHDSIRLPPLKPDAHSNAVNLQAVRFAPPFQIPSAFKGSSEHQPFSGYPIDAFISDRPSSLELKSVSPYYSYLRNSPVDTVSPWSRPSFPYSIPHDITVVDISHKWNDFTSSITSGPTQYPAPLYSTNLPEDHTNVLDNFYLDPGYFSDPNKFDKEYNPGLYSSSSTAHTSEHTTTKRTTLEHTTLKTHTTGSAGITVPTRTTRFHTVPLPYYPTGTPTLDTTFMLDYDLYIDTSSTRRSPTGYLDTSSTRRSPTGYMDTSSTRRRPTGYMDTSSTRRIYTGYMETSSTRRSPTGYIKTSSTIRSPTGYMDTSSTRRIYTGYMDTWSTHRSPTGYMDTSSTHRTPTGYMDTSSTHHSTRSPTTIPVDFDDIDIDISIPMHYIGGKKDSSWLQLSTTYTPIEKWVKNMTQTSIRPILHNVDYVLGSPKWMVSRLRHDDSQADYYGDQGSGPKSTPNAFEAGKQRKVFHENELGSLYVGTLPVKNEKIFTVVTDVSTVLTEENKKANRRYLPDKRHKYLKHSHTPSQRQRRKKHITTGNSQLATVQARFRKQKRVTKSKMAGNLQSEHHLEMIGRNKYLTKSDLYNELDMFKTTEKIRIVKPIRALHDGKIQKDTKSLKDGVFFQQIRKTLVNSQARRAANRMKVKAETIRKIVEGSSYSDEETHLKNSLREAIQIGMGTL